MEVNIIYVLKVVKCSEEEESHYENRSFSPISALQPTYEISGFHKRAKFEHYMAKEVTNMELFASKLSGNDCVLVL